MSLNKIQQLVKDALITHGWSITNEESVITKNACYLNLTGNTYESKPLSSFVYSNDDINSIINNDYNITKLDKPVAIGKPLIKISNQHYYMEKYGWLLCKGKYNNSFSYVDMNNTEDKNTQKFLEFINELDSIAERDYLQLRGVKQSLSPIIRKESIFVPTPSNKPFDIDSVIQIKQESSRCDLFKAGALFKVNFILEDLIVITVINQKGIVTSKHYELDVNTVIAEINENNIQLVELTPTTEDIEELVWLPFNDTDMTVNLPTVLDDYISNDKQKTAIMECFSKILNFSVLLNPNVSEFAYPVLIDMLEKEYCVDEMFTQRIKESNALQLYQYLSMGFNPIRFFDDSIDSITLEELLREALYDADTYKATLSKLDLNEDVIDFLYRYKFATGEILDVECDSTTRWQFLLPNLYSEYFDPDIIKRFEQLIKMYAIMTQNGCVLKATFLDAQVKGAILNYFKIPQPLELLGQKWEDLLLNLLNRDTMIEFTDKGISIKGSLYAITRDVNSVAVINLARKAVWRCVFLNEEKIIMHDGSDIYF